ncbi:hypothetical protein COBT_003223 [Conglomerata obtusa]
MIKLFLSFKILKCVIINLIESTPAHGKLNIISRVEKPSFLIMTFPKITFPYLRNHKNIIKISEDRKKNLKVIFYNNSAFNIVIEYSKILMIVKDYTWNAERGFYFPESFCFFEKQKYIIDPIFDMYYVPDFTVPFLAFNTCGCIFALLFGIIIKSAIRKKNSKDF